MKVCVAGGIRGSGSVGLDEVTEISKSQRIPFSAAKCAKIRFDLFE